jgi:hypothetical protein
MGVFDFLNPAKQAAASGSRWAITNYFKTEQIDPTLTDTEVVNNLLSARYIRVSLEPDQESRFRHYESLELANVLDLVMATLDIELDVNPVHNPAGFATALRVVERRVSEAAIDLSTSDDFEHKWNHHIRPQR